MSFPLFYPSLSQALMESSQHVAIQTVMAQEDSTFEITTVRVVLNQTMGTYELSFCEDDTEISSVVFESLQQLPWAWNTLRSQHILISFHNVDFENENWTTLERWMASRRAWKAIGLLRPDHWPWSFPDPSSPTTPKPPKPLNYSPYRRSDVPQAVSNRNGIAFLGVMLLLAGGYAGIVASWWYLALTILISPVIVLFLIIKPLQSANAIKRSFEKAEGEYKFWIQMQVNIYLQLLTPEQRTLARIRFARYL